MAIIKTALKQSTDYDDFKNDICDIVKKFSSVSRPVCSHEVLPYIYKEGSVKFLYDCKQGNTNPRDTVAGYVGVALRDLEISGRITTNGTKTSPITSTQEDAYY